MEEPPAPAPAPVVVVKIEDVLPAKPADADEATAAAPIGLTRDAVFAKAKETGLTLVKQVKAESYGYAELPHRAAVRAMLAESKKLCGNGVGRLGAAVETGLAAVFDLLGTALRERT
eukprot:gene24296-9215_t